MGLFSKAPAGELDPQLENAILATDERQKGLTRKLLGKSQVGIAATVESGERVVTIVGDWDGYLVALTDRRIMKFKGPKLRTTLKWDEVARVQTAADEYGQFHVSIDTHRSELYRRDDGRRYSEDYFMAVKFSDPQMAKDVALVVRSAIAS
jgi:hypothetical protein